MLTTDDLFTYHVPTEVTKPLHDAINAAFKQCAAAMPGFNDAGPERFVVINEATKAFYVVIDGTAPPSADKAAALRCVRLARNAFNEMCCGISDSWHSRYNLYNIGLDELYKAKWQANAAIALNGEQVAPMTYRST